VTGAIDSSGFITLAADFEAKEYAIASEVRAVVVKGADKVKKTMRADMRKSRHFKAVAQDIDFDTIENRDSMEAEIGPVPGRGKDHAGGLAHIAYFGAPNGGGGTVRNPQAALDEEEADYLAALAALVDRGL